MRWFKYSGRETSLLAIHDALRERAESGEGRLGLHPTQLSRATGYPMLDVQERLQGSPELFVKLPRSADGVVRYRLTSAASAMSRDEVEGLVARRANSERLQLYAVVIILACFGFILLVTVVPAARLGF